MEDIIKYDGIILDIDGTIWNTTGIVAVAWNKAIDMSGFNARKVVAQDLQKEFGKTMDKIAESLWPDLNADERAILITSCCAQEQEALYKLDMDISYPGVVETVKELSGLNNFYVVSNCQSGYIELTLEKTGLTPYVRDFECYGRTGRGKAENLMMLVSRNQITSPLYIGDTQTDCDACKQAGIPFVWASYGFGKADSYLAKLERFSDLTQILSH